MTRRRHPDWERHEAARAEGIALTPQGQPLFARDMARWLELGATPSQLTDAQRDEDEHADL